VTIDDLRETWEVHRVNDPDVAVGILGLDVGFVGGGGQ
jgi:hypothetical protein